MDIEITFINNSNDMNNSSVVIFQKNVATNFDSTTIAWTVIKNCGRNWSHKFTYPMQFSVAAADSYGNISNLSSAINGQKWSVIRAESGDILQLDTTPSTSTNEVEIQNELGTGSIDAQIYKDGKLLACKTGVSPGEKAVFEFKPALYVGIASQIEEGDAMNSAILTAMNQEFSLLGISTANLIMTGGGVGPNATPFVFNLVPTS